MNSEQVHFNMDSPFKTQLRPLNLLVLINLWNVGQFVLGQNAEKIITEDLQAA